MIPLRKFSFRASRSCGFSLLEVLASTVVLVVVLVIFAQILSQTRNASDKESKRMSAFSGAVDAFDRLAMDLAMRVRDAQGGLTLSDNGKAVSFPAQVRNFEASSRLSQVSYEIQDGMLKRKIEPIGWSDEDFSDHHEMNFELLSDGIFALQFSFVRRNGRIYPFPSEHPENDVALVVTFACLDQTSRKRSDQSTELLETLSVNMLTGVPEEGSDQSPMQLWESTDLTFDENSAFESTLRNHVYFYERRYALD